jgi:hypothetical protein
MLTTARQPNCCDQHEQRMVANGLPYWPSLSQRADLAKPQRIKQAEQKREHGSNENIRQPPLRFALGWASSCAVLCPTICFEGCCAEPRLRRPLDAGGKSGAHWHHRQYRKSPRRKRPRAFTCHKSSHQGGFNLSRPFRRISRNLLRAGKRSVVEPANRKVDRAERALTRIAGPAAVFHVIVARHSAEHPQQGATLRLMVVGK